MAKSMQSSAFRCGYCRVPVSADPVWSAEGEVFCCYGCRVLGASAVGRSMAGEDRGIDRVPWFRIGLGVAIASQAMLVGFAVNLTPPEGSIRPLLHAALAGSSLLVFAILGGPLLGTAWDCACRRRLTVEWLFLAGIVGAFGASVWSSLTGFGAVYYEVVAILLVFYTLGKALTAQARQRAMAEASRLRDVFDVCQRIAADGTLQSCRAAEVVVGDRIRVGAGEPIPVDGRVLSGAAFVRETPLTGEPDAVVRRERDRVLAGSWSEDGDLVIEATVPGRDRELDRLVAWVDEARQTVRSDAGIGPRLRPLVDRITAWFLPTVLVAAVTTGLVWSLRGQWREGLFHGLAVLLVACPCALGLAAPLAWWSALATLASRGVVFRSGDALERLAAVNRVVFDKTGTLSEDRQTLIDLAVRADGLPRVQLMAFLKAAQAGSTHPIARAFDRIPESVPSGVGVESLRTEPACGIEAVVQDEGRIRHLRVGVRHWVLESATGSDPVEERLRQEIRCEPSDQLIHVAVDGRLEGIAVVRERLRDSVEEVCRHLLRLGCRLSVFTGDREAWAARVLPEALGLELVGSLTPEEKARRVAEHQAAGEVVLFVGDGVNDTPALRTAAVGMALHSGAGLATATAEVVLWGGQLSEVPRAIEFTRRVQAGVRSNLLFAATYNLLGMTLAATGRIGPISAALLMVGSSTIVVLRAARLGSDACHGPDEAGQQPGWARICWTAGVVAQIPLLIHLGQLVPVQAGVTAAVLLGVAAVPWLRRLSVSWLGRVWDGAALRMGLAMLGPGNLGMALGWWVEADWNPVMSGGACLCCRSHQYFDLTGSVPWMVVGMLAGGLPSMVGEDDPGSGLGRGPRLVLATVGMVLGMAWGGDLVLALLGPMHPWQFLGAWVGMTGGMLLGMGLLCGAGEAIAAVRGRGSGTGG